MPVHSRGTANALTRRSCASLVQLGSHSCLFSHENAAGYWNLVSHVSWLRSVYDLTALGCGSFSKERVADMKLGACCKTRLCQTRLCPTAIQRFSPGMAALRIVATEETRGGTYSLLQGQIVYWALVEQNFAFLWIPGSSINTKQIFFNSISTRTQFRGGNE